MCYKHSQCQPDPTDLSSSNMDLTLTTVEYILLGIKMHSESKFDRKEVALLCLYTDVLYTNLGL